jgi:two-component system sensor histidine kinase KdpD
MKLKNYLILLLIMSVTTVASIYLNKLGIYKENVLMILIVGVLMITALTRGYRFGIIASVVSVMMFNYFFTEPLRTFAISDSNDIILIFFFLLASIISSSLTARFQRQLLISKKNEQTAQLLYKVTQRLLNVTGESNIIRQGIYCIKEYTGYDSIIELTENRHIYSSDNIGLYDNEKCIELGITGLVKELGTLKVFYADTNPNVEQKWLIETVAAQIGIALDRELVYNERENIRIAMEKEHLKSNLLRSISHDLRTPLTGIAGASSYILQRSNNLDRESIEHLVGDINEQAVWLTTLVENMLSMIRIDNGKLEIKKQIEVVDDVVNEAVAHVIGLSERNFRSILPEDLIAIPMDGKMIVQVLINLLNNAVNHTSKNCPIELSVQQVEGYVEFNVADGGAGIDPSIKDNLFEAFSTSGKIGADGKKGIGLGLTICKAFVQAHGGSISAEVSQLGGMLFKFRLPYKEQNNG